MITIKAIFNENGTAIPSEKIDLKFGSFFNGTEFIYFESNEEQTEYLNGLELCN